MKCTICSHPERKSIDRAIVNGDTLQNIAKKYQVGYTSIHRHKESGHVSKYMIAAKERELVKNGRTLQGDLDFGIEMTKKAIEKALDEDMRCFGPCSSALMKLLELEARIKGLSGEKDDDPGIDRAIAKMKEHRDNAK
jgi:hypothetical protein